MSACVSVAAAIQPSPEERLDRSKWFKPLVSVIVTYYNYSHQLKDALLSLLDQTHQNWECVVVDDGSSAIEKKAAETIIQAIGCSKIRFLRLDENIGQTQAFFASLAETTGEFVCLLDPDDRYAETFMEEMLNAHLNETVFGPLLCCDQRLIRNGALLSGVNTWHKLRYMHKRPGEKPEGLAEVPQAPVERLLYFAPTTEGWLWPATSSMMFRRAALNLARPQKQLAYKVSTDAYLAQGLHRLGGTLLLTKPLVYRGLHDTNSWLSDDIFTTHQHVGKANRENYASQALQDVIEAIRANGGGRHLDRHVPPKPAPAPAPAVAAPVAEQRGEPGPAPAPVPPAPQAQQKIEPVPAPLPHVPQVQQKIEPVKKKETRTVFQRWERSIMKRWHSLAGRSAF